MQLKNTKLNVQKLKNIKFIFNFTVILTVTVILELDNNRQVWNWYRPTPTGKFTKIISFCMNALDLQCPWTMQRCLSKFFGEELKYKIYFSYKEIVMIAILCSYGKPFNWKLTFSSILTKAWTAFLTSLQCTYIHIAIRTYSLL